MKMKLRKGIRHRWAYLLPTLCVYWEKSTTTLWVEVELAFLNGWITLEHEHQFDSK